MDDLRVELGLSRAKIREALERLQAAGFVDALGQGSRPGEKRGAKRQIYVSLDEK